MKINLFISLILSLIVWTTASQELVLRATKSMDYRFVDCSSLMIQGEKATIRIIGKAQQSVDLKVSLVAMHKNQSTAVNDLNYIRIETKKNGTQLVIKNYYESKNRKIESNLSVVYELTVPEHLAIQLYNLYGSVTLQNLRGTKSAELAFGRLELQSISGVTQIQLKYSNLSAGDVAGQLTGTLAKSDAVLTKHSASAELSMSYGALTASILPDSKTFRVVGNRTEITVELPSAEYAMDLQTLHSQVEINGKKAGSRYRSTSTTSNKLIVSTSYCPIKIQSQ